jgi:hypothetical protein
MTTPLLRPFDAPEPAENMETYLYGYELAMDLMETRKVKFINQGYSLTYARYLSFEQLKADFILLERLGETVIKGMSRYLSVLQADLLDKLESNVPGEWAASCYQN